MAMSISGSSSASSLTEGWWVVEGSGADVGLELGEAMVGVDGDGIGEEDGGGNVVDLLSNRVWERK